MENETEEQRRNEMTSRIKLAAGIPETNNLSITRVGFGELRINIDLDGSVFERDNGHFTVPHEFRITDAMEIIHLSDMIPQNYRFKYTLTSPIYPQASNHMYRVDLRKRMEVIQPDNNHNLVYNCMYELYFEGEYEHMITLHYTNFPTGIPVLYCVYKETNNINKTLLQKKIIRFFIRLFRALTVNVTTTFTQNGNISNRDVTEWPTAYGSSFCF